ncbi:MAG TPA: hypothetical protein VGF84_17595 [Micromonosporaceae bacterium]
MNDPVGVLGLDDYDGALHREATVIAVRFPDVAPVEVERRLRTRFDDLARNATVASHLVTVAGASVTAQLRAAGKEFHAPATDA